MASRPFSIQLLEATSRYFPRVSLGKALTLEQEAHERVINLPEDDPEHISLMLQFLYESRIEFDKKASKEQTIVAHGQLFGIACKYGIDKLKGYSAAEFAKLKGSVQEEYMIKALANAYSQAELPRESLLLDKLFDENLLHIPAADSKSFRMLLESNPGFAAAFAVKMLERFNFHKLLAPEYYHFLENVLDKGKHQGRKWKCFTTHCICYPCDNVVVIGDPDAQGVRYIESKCQKCKRANLKIAGFI